MPEVVLRPAVSPERRKRIYIEAWAADRGSPYQIEDDSEEPVGRYLEGGGFGYIMPARPTKSSNIAFIDGTRRADVLLSQLPDNAASPVPGLAGVFAVGAVFVEADQEPRFGIERVTRVVIWPEGAHAPLPSFGQWSWKAAYTRDSSPQGPLRQLQREMQIAEGILAADLSGDWTIVADGTLHQEYSSRTRIAGYIKSHHRQLLPDEDARKLPGLPAGARTTLFELGAEHRRISCYLRLVERGPMDSPLAGIIRLEFPEKELDGTLIDELASLLPRYAGIPHRDPRAPQNLQPVGALERKLRHAMGDPGLSLRAVREAVSRIE